MRTKQKILLAVIICMTQGMLPLLLFSSPIKIDNLIFIIICTLSCSVAIRITHWLKFFLRFPNDLVFPIICLIQFIVYSITAFALAIVIHKNDKTIREPDKATEPTHD